MTVLSPLIAAPTLLYTALLGAIIYALSVAVYNVYLHPLSKFPGPKLAVCSPLVEFYHDVIRGGMYMWEIDRMHQKFGPIVRINQRELHIKDPDFIDEVYASGHRRREKDLQLVSAFLSPESMFSTVDHEHHRMRRDLLKNFFSRRSLESLGPFLQESMELLCQKLQSTHSTGEIVRLDSLFADLTADVITKYSFGESTNYLRRDNVGNDIQRAAYTSAVGMHINRFIPVLRLSMPLFPPWILKAFFPIFAESLAFRDMLVVNSKLALEKAEENPSPVTIFEALSSPSIPAQERSIPRLMDEGSVVVGAGTMTTARALALASFYIYSQEIVLKKLREELQSVMPELDSQPSWAELEKLPYLTAVIAEALRLSFGIVLRAARIAPDEALQYKNFLIPPGTPVSISTYLTHMDPDKFPQPEVFRPERWIEARAAGFPLHKYLMSFSRGSRICLGMSLAYFELYVTLAHIVRKFDLDMDGTTKENISCGRNFALPMPKSVPYFVKVKVMGVVER